MDQAGATIAGQAHWTHKGDVKLFLFEKQATVKPVRGTVLFIHGSSMASTPTFDLQVPGRPYSSAMDYFAAQGYDAARIQRVPQRWDASAPAAAREPS